MNREKTSEKVCVEIHMHSCFSFDSSTSLDDLERIGEEQGVDCYALTDHDTIEGALRLRDRGKVDVIMGEEISTAFGDVIGLFLEEAVPPGLSPEETIDAIHGQGGLVYIPHPFDRKRKTRLFREAITRCIDRIDLFEVWNGRTRHDEDNRRAARFAKEHGLATAVGSDAHKPAELGRAKMEIDRFGSAAGFLGAVRSGKAVLPGGTGPSDLAGRLLSLFRRMGNAGTGGGD